MEEILNAIYFDPVIGKLIMALLGIAIILTIIGVIKKSLTRYIKDQEYWYKTRKAVNLAGYIAVIIFLMVVYSDKLGGIPVTLGVASAGIAFALQEVIVSIAGWIAIMVGGIFKTGDRVKLGGVKGDVIDLGVLRTTIMEVDKWVKGDLYNGRIVRVANSFVFKEPVYNYSSDFPFLWDEITIPIKFGSDYKLARTIIDQAAEEVVGDYTHEAQGHWETMVRKFLIENASTSPVVTLVINDNWVEYTLRYVVDYRKRRTTKDLLFSRILEEVDQSAGKVQFASATFQVVGLPPLDVKIRQS
jgi:small-conductance mechanosensitive channel